jgi:hypothetical protein
MTIELNLWTIAFLLTLAVVVVLVSYIRFLLKQLTFVSTNLTDLNNEAVSFAAHLKSVYELEAFYGDETLKGLLEHSMYFTSKVDNFSDIMDLTADPIDEEEEEETEDFDDEAENKPQPQINQEILYAGTRRRNS